MSNTITRALAGLAIAGTMTGAAFAGTAAAHADAGGFLAGLGHNGIYIIDTNTVINHGYTVCNMLNSGNYSALDAQNWLYLHNGPLSWHGAFNEVGLATAYLCPENNYLTYAPDRY